MTQPLLRVLGGRVQPAKASTTISMADRTGLKRATPKNLPRAADRMAKARNAFNQGYVHHVD